jgi:hypothetical protein
LCALLLGGTLLSEELRVDLGWGGHLWLDFYLAGGSDWLDIDWYCFSFDSGLLDVGKDMVCF